MLKPGNYSTQVDNVLAHLLKGHSITPRDAIEQYGCWRLAAVIYNLRRQGYKISTKKVSSRRGKIFASYKMNENTPMPYQK